MADIAVPFALTTPGGVILFNDTGTDQFNIFGADEYYITDIQGLDGSPIRAPIDNAPQTHGGLVHPFFKGPRHITIEGALMVRSTRVMNAVVVIRNEMEDDLLTALESILQADGTLAWTPQGEAARSLTVRYEIPCEFRGISLKTFAFGLVAANPDW